MKISKLNQDLYNDLAKAREGKLKLKDLVAFTNATQTIITGENYIHKYNNKKGYSKKVDSFED